MSWRELGTLTRGWVDSMGGVWVLALVIVAWVMAVVLTAWLWEP